MAGVILSCIVLKCWMMISSWGLCYPTRAEALRTFYNFLIHTHGFHAKPSLQVCYSGFPIPCSTIDVSATRGHLGDATAILSGISRLLWLARHPRHCSYDRLSSFWIQAYKYKYFWQFPVTSIVSESSSHSKVQQHIFCFFAMAESIPIVVFGKSFETATQIKKLISPEFEGRILRDDILAKFRY